MPNKLEGCNDQAVFPLVKTCFYAFTYAKINPHPSFFTFTGCPIEHFLQILNFQ